jgi:hypothetical protein
MIPAPSDDGGGSSGWSKACAYISTAEQMFFSMTGLDPSLGKHQVLRNGLLMLVGADHDYVVSPEGVTFTHGLDDGDVVLIFG